MLSTVIILTLLNEYAITQYVHVQVSQRRMGDYEASHRDERSGPPGMHLLTLMEHCKSFFRQFCLSCHESILYIFVYQRLNEIAGIRAAVLGRGRFHRGDQRQVSGGAKGPRGKSQVRELISMGGGDENAW